MKIELRGGPCDGERISVTRAESTAPIWHELPDGEMALYAHDPDAVAIHQHKAIPVSVHVVTCSKAEAAQAMENAGMTYEGRIVR